MGEKESRKEAYNIIPFCLHPLGPGGDKVATESNERGVGSIAARAKNAWGCDHEMDFFLTGPFNATITTHDLTVSVRLCIGV